MTLFCVCSLCKSVSCTHVNVKGVYSLLRIEDILQSIGKDTHQAKQFMLCIPAGEIAIPYHTIRIRIQCKGPQHAVTSLGSVSPVNSPCHWQNFMCSREIGCDCFTRKGFSMGKHSQTLSSEQTALECSILSYHTFTCALKMSSSSMSSIKHL